jgi:hypothetical protein
MEALLASSWHVYGMVAAATVVQDDDSPWIIRPPPQSRKELP